MGEIESLSILTTEHVNLTYLSMLSSARCMAVVDWQLWISRQESVHVTEFVRIFFFEGILTNSATDEGKLLLQLAQQDITSSNLLNSLQRRDERFSGAGGRKD